MVFHSLAKWQLVYKYWEEMNAKEGKELIMVAQEIYVQE